MPAPIKGTPRLDLPALLSTATLRLAPDLRTVRTRGSLLVVKNNTDRRYLVIAQQQWPLLERFARGSTVPEVLCDIISENHCPPLRDFYELVLNAYQNGVLYLDGKVTPVYITPAKWRLGLPPPVARIGSVAVIGCSLIVLILTRVQMPSRALDVIIAGLAVAAAGSLGQFLAACVLRGAGCAVYQPRFSWRTLVPGFRINLDEAVMGGQETEVNVAVIRLAPMFLLAAVSALKLPHYYLVLLGAVFAQLSPLWHTPMRDLLRAWFHDPRLSTQTLFVFAQSKPFALLSQARRQFSDRKFLAAGTVATAVWLALAFIVGCGLFQAHAVELLHRFYAAGGLRYSGLVIVCALGAVILGVAGLAAWIVASHLAAWMRERLARRRRLQITGNSPQAVAELLANVVIFRDLSPEARLEVATAMKPVEHARGDFVIRYGEAATRLFIVVSGRLEVLGKSDDGKATTVAEMGSGDVLGEIAVVRGGTRTRSVRCATRCLLLALDKADFERLVLIHIPRASVEDAVEKVGFLQNVEMARNWPQQSLATFARLARIQEYNEGDLVVREGSENLYLYLVRRGEFAVTQHGKLVRKLRTGDSFGEIGMLQNSATLTSVVASKPGSCLVVPKADFLKFITQDFTISLQFEHIGAKRKARETVVKGPGFDVMRG